MDTCGYGQCMNPLHSLARIIGRITLCRHAHHAWRYDFHVERDASGTRIGPMVGCRRCGQSAPLH